MKCKKHVFSVFAMAFVMMGGCASIDQVPNENNVNKNNIIKEYTELGREYFRIGDTTNAKTALQRVKQLDPDYAPMNHLMALVFQFENEQELAQQFFLQALTQEPNNATYRNNYGQFLFVKGEYALACDEFNKAASDPFYASRALAFENLGRCYLMLKQDQEAVSAFTKALEIQSNRDFSLLVLSELLLNQGQVSTAQRWFGRYENEVEAKRLEHNAQSLWLGVRLSRLSGEVSKAATYGILLQSLYPDSQEYRQFQESLN